MAFLTKSLPRRTVLKGIGTTMALPFLDAMLPPMRAATKPPHRFQAFYVPNGMAMEYWTPKGEGTAFELAPIMEPLAPYKDQMLVFSGIKASWNYIHAGASGSFLTGTPRGGSNEIEIIADVSIDQMLGRHFAKETQLASLEISHGPARQRGRLHRQSELRLSRHALVGAARRSRCRWTGIRARFSRSCSAIAAARTAPRARSDLQQHKSILDSVTGKLASLKQELGPQDQGKVDEYTDAVRDVERRIQMAERQSNIELPAFDQPLGAPPVFEDHLALMMDLQVLAFQSDLTRVISFMLSKEQSPRPYPQIGVPEAHHPLSHHNNIPELIEKMSKINTLSRQVVLAVSGQAQGDAGRRWLAARPHYDPLWRGHLQQQRAFGRQPAADAGGRRLGQDQGRPAFEVRQQAFAGEPADDHHGQDGLSGREGRRQHGQTSDRYAFRGLEHAIAAALILRSPCR